MKEKMKNKYKKKNNLLEKVYNTESIKAEKKYMNLVFIV
jgi:hypothetical protein